MKRIISVITYFILSLITLVIIITISLNVCYNRIASSGSDKESLQSRSEPEPEPSLLEKTNKTKDLPVSLLPYPRELIITKGTFRMPEKILFIASEDMQSAIEDYLHRLFGITSAGTSGSGNLIITENKNIPKEGYTLSISPSRISIQSSEFPGLYYALVTLKHLNEEFSGKIPCMEIEDYPDLEIRGVMLDIDRNKIPKLETLIAIVDLLSELKINHFELYMEGFSFAYPTYQELWEKTETPMTGEEFRMLDQYCKVSSMLKRSMHSAGNTIRT